MLRGMGSVSAAIALLLASLAYAGCGDDSDGVGRNGGDGEGQASGAASWPLGRWEGELHQKDLQPFMVWATVGSLSEANENRVRYSGLDCRGGWTPLGGDAGIFRFREEITSGRSEKCKGVGVVTMRRLTGNRAAYSFRGGGVESRGVLTSRGG
jgi:hypothetical protein